MSRVPMRYLLLAGAALALATAGRPLPAKVERPAMPAILRQTDAMLRRRFTQDIEELANWCLKNGLDEEAVQTRRLLESEQHDEGAVYLPLLPRKVVGGPPPDGTAVQREWHARFHRLRRELAEELFSLARRAFKAGQVSYAYDIVHEVAELHPDHPTARALLGYVRYRDLWVTPFESQKLRSGWVWHEKFGWLKRDHVRRYEQGMRWVDGKWVSAAEEARLRQDLNHAWVVSTDHYRILTNHSLEAGVELGNKLESLYRVFYRVFASFFTPQEQMALLFEGRGDVAAARRSDPFQVVYFRDREEYASQPALRQLLGKNLSISAGAYVPEKQAAFFFHVSDGDLGSLLHEGTHQLFSESRGFAGLVGKEANFWIVEGIACYMESLRQEGNYLRIGGSDALRFRDARHRALQDRFYKPLAELSSWGIGRFQSSGSDELRLLYSQCAGMTHFLMHYDGGRYREPLVQYLQAVYTLQDTPGTLSQLTRASYGELDEQYLAYLKEAG